MADHFNKLTPAQAERLAMLAEEAGEVVQAVGKVLRHGYDSTHPSTGEGNLTSLEGELVDIFAIVSMMQSAGDIDTFSLAHVGDRVQQKLHYTHEQQ